MAIAAAEASDRALRSRQESGTAVGHLPTIVEPSARSTQPAESLESSTTKSQLQDVADDALDAATAGAALLMEHAALAQNSMAKIHHAQA